MNKKIEKLVVKQRQIIATMELSSSQWDLLKQALKLERQIMAEQLTKEFNQ